MMAYTGNYSRNNNNDDKKANSKIAYLFCLKKIEKKKKDWR